MFGIWMAYHDPIGEVEHVETTQDAHNDLDPGHDIIQDQVEVAGEEHDQEKSCKNTQIKGQGPFKAKFIGMGHGHNVVGTGCKGHNNHIGQKGTEIKQKNPPIYIILFPRTID